jgi:hypothetical protein
MENRNILNQNVLILSLVVFLAAFSRVIPHAPNFSIIGALALFSGAFFQNKYLRFSVPLSAMLLSDLVIGFHATMPFVYGSFILVSFLGKFLVKDKQPLKLISFSLLSSILFFLITNFGVWLATEMYSKTISGLITSYYMGLPFFRNTILSDLVYSFTLFYGYTYLENKTKSILKVYNSSS